MNEKIELLPCPFCGSRFKMSQEPHDNHPIAGKFYIYHEYGPLESAARKCRIEVKGHFETAKEAANFWNRSAAEPVAATRPVVDINHPERLRVLAYPPKHADDLAVDRFAEAMKAKLAKKRAEGRGGWEDKDELDMNERLSRFLREHVDKGDPLDVMNFAMMIHQRGERIAPASAEPMKVEVTP